MINCLKLLKSTQCRRKNHVRTLGGKKCFEKLKTVRAHSAWLKRQASSCYWQGITVTSGPGRPHPHLTCRAGHWQTPTPPLWPLLGCQAHTARQAASSGLQRAFPGVLDDKQGQRKVPVESKQHLISPAAPQSERPNLTRVTFNSSSSKRRSTLKPQV